MRVLAPSEFAFASARCLLENGVRKILFVLAICLGFISLAPAAEMNLSLADGSAVVGEIMKSDDGGVMARTGSEIYTNIPWARFSQEALKQLATNPKVKPASVEPFIEPEPSQRTNSKAEITINPVVRPELPSNPSLMGGLFKSPVGLFILFVIYLANLFAAYEISVIKARSGLQVIGVAALLPIIGPVISLRKKRLLPKLLGSKRRRKLSRRFLRAASSLSINAFSRPSLLDLWASPGGKR